MQQIKKSYNLLNRSLRSKLFSFAFTYSFNDQKEMRVFLLFFCWNPFFLVSNSYNYVNGMIPRCLERRKSVLFVNWLFYCAPMNISFSWKLKIKCNLLLFSNPLLLDISSTSTVYASSVSNYVYLSDWNTNTSILYELGLESGFRIRYFYLLW